jgi:hypothetical protein
MIRPSRQGTSGPSLSEAMSALECRARAAGPPRRRRGPQRRASRGGPPPAGRPRRGSASAWVSTRTSDPSGRRRRYVPRVRSAPRMESASASAPRPARGSRTVRRASLTDVAKPSNPSSARAKLPQRQDATATTGSAATWPRWRPPRGVD